MKLTPEMPEQAQLARKGSSILNRQSSKFHNEAIAASNIKNIKFEIKNNKLDQLQGMSSKMAANGIRTHGRTNQWRTLELRSQQSLNP